MVSVRVIPYPPNAAIAEKGVRKCTREQMPDRDRDAPATRLPISDGTILGIDAGPVLSILEPLPEEIDVVLSRFDDLTPDLLGRVAPDCVAAPLVAPGFDILDLAQRLDSYDYAGALVAITFPIPDRDVILRELGATSSDIEFHLLEIR